MIAIQEAQEIQEFIPKRGRPKKDAEAFSETIYKIAKNLWLNGYRPFTRDNILDYLKFQLGWIVKPEKITMALNYLKSKNLLKCKSKQFWYLNNKKEYPDASTQRYYYLYHPLPRCASCIWLKYKITKHIIERKDGKVIEKTIIIHPNEEKEVSEKVIKTSKNKKNRIIETKIKREPICTCPFSKHFNKNVDVHYPRFECISKPYSYEGFKSEEEIYKNKLHVNPYFPKQYFELKDGKPVWIVKD